MAKRGRPKSDDPKRNRIVVRFEDREFDMLKEFAMKNNLTIAEAIRKGVDVMIDYKR